MKNMARLFCFSSLLVFYSLLVVSAARADSSPMSYEGFPGSSAVPIRNDKIRMVREVVDIDWVEWGEFSVKADFWFKNTSDQEQEVQMGFPIDYTTWQEDAIPEALKTFQVIWKHQRIMCHFAPVQPPDKKDAPLHRQWVYWTVRFKPHEKAFHRVSYTFPTWQYDHGSEDDSSYTYLNYILKSGAAWKGPIESAIVNVHYGHLPNNRSEIDPSDLRFYPKGYVLNKKKRTATWKFRKFEPDRDIFFGWSHPDDGTRGDLEDTFEDLDKEQVMTFKDFPLKPKQTPRASVPQAKNP